MDATLAGPAPLAATLRDPARAIGGPLFDAVWIWGAPLWSLVLCAGGLLVAGTLRPEAAVAFGAGLGVATSMLTSAHLIAVVPRAYVNRDVFRRFPLRFTVVPALACAAMALSHPLLALGAVAAFYWDVWHSAMQTFGFARIYEVKAGNSPHEGRRLDLLLNVAMYVGPIAGGATFAAHVEPLTALTEIPGHLEGAAGAIRAGAIALGLVALGAYAIGIARRKTPVPAHKAVLLLHTGLVSLLAWGFTPPVAAFATVNTFHAVQYFAVVWAREGERTTRALRLPPSRAGRAIGLAIFLALCAGFGAAYWFSEASWQWALPPFITVSLMHFWYDGFVWSVRKGHA